MRVFLMQTDVIVDISGAYVVFQPMSATPFKAAK